MDDSNASRRLSIIQEKYLDNDENKRKDATLEDTCTDQAYQAIRQEDRMKKIRLSICDKPMVYQQSLPRTLARF